MCTSIILFRKEHHWPLIIGSNRDENLSRKSEFPARHWKKNRPQIIGGYDGENKGSWISVNDYGLVSIIHNRKLENDNEIKKKSRGNIILDTLNFENIADSIDYLQNLNQNFYNGFNIIICDKSNCFWGKHVSVNNKVKIEEVNEGLSILTDNNLNNTKDKKINYYLNKFSQAPVPNPDDNDWLSWELLLATDKIDNQNYPEEAICFTDKKNNFGTLSSTLIAISNISTIKQFKNPIVFRATNYPPNIDDYIDVELN
jgi:uncharacterized protein with NRDE domain